MSCGDCTLCCKLMGVKELSKPVGMWCSACDLGMKGCTIYKERPQSCVDFQCYWLNSQGASDPAVRMPLVFRPDKARCIIVEHDKDKVVVRCDVGDVLAFRRQPMWTFLYMRANTCRVFSIAGRRVWEIYGPAKQTGKEFEEITERVRMQGDTVCLEETR